MNGIPKELLLSVGGALLCAFAVSFLMCPLVKSFAYKIGAIDVPKDNRRMHKKPVPRLGGLAIFLGFIVSILLFVKVDHQLQGILLGASIIVVLGVVDDMSPLRAYFKFCVQIFAALVAVFHGVVIQTLSNPNVFAESPYWDLGWLSIPITVLWIVGITNAVNLIDGLDGLACGVSTISAISMLVIALLVSESDVALVMAALVGACLGFMPYNKNPAKMFMGDTGSTFLGYILATISIQGLFKYYAIVSFAVPFLILGLPMFDTLFAIIRRLLKGQSPLKADRGHVHRPRPEPHARRPEPHPPPAHRHGPQPEASRRGAVCHQQYPRPFRRDADVERRDQGDALSDGAGGGGVPRLARHLPPRYRQGIAGGKGGGRGEEHRDCHTGGNRACGT